MRGSAALVALALCGCDKILGLTEVLPRPDSPPGLVVTGRVPQHVVTNDSTYQPVEADRVIPRAELALAATLDDGTPAQVTYNEDGTFEFALEHAGQAYKLDATLYGSTSELQLDLPQLVLGSRVAGRPDARLLESSDLEFPFPTMATATSSAWVLTIGQYSQTDTRLFGPTVQFDWKGATPVGGLPLGLLDASAFDLVYTVAYDPNARADSTTYTVISAASSMAITQQANAPTTLPAPAAVAPNQCVHFTTHGIEEYTRVNQALPGTFASYEDWILYWMPDPDVLSGAGAIDLAGASFAPAQDVDVSPPVYVPMQGGQLVISSFSGELLDITAPGATTPTAEFSGNRRFAKVSAQTPGSCGAAAVDLPGSVGLAGIPSLDGTVLDTPNQPIAITSATVTWAITAPGPIDTTNVQLYEVVNAGGNTSVSPAGTAIGVVGTATSAQLDPTQLKSGHTYVLYIATHRALVHASSGDWDTVAFPIENANTWSQPFFVP